MNKACLRRMAALVAMLAAPLAQAHDAASAVPEEAGLRLGLSAAITQLDASTLLPSAQLAGYVLQGDPGVDRRGLGLEHGVAELGWRLDETWAASVALGKHDSDRAHVETAAIYRRWHTPGSDWQLSAGRQKPELGPVLGGAGHMDRFALMPLAKRAALNDDWVDDGLQLGWRQDTPDGHWLADAGLWRGAVFPGSADNGAVVPALHLGLEHGDWRVDAFTARFQPKGRGARISTSGHTHVSPECNAALVQVLCFSGSTQVSAASLRWDSSALPVMVTAAAWLRQDSGTLESANGSAAYQGRNRGGWLEAVWRWQPQAELGWRTERLSARHSLTGSGATLLASEAGFGSYQPAHRNALLLGYSPNPRMDWRIEAGREQVAGTAARYVLLRWVFRLDHTFASSGL